MTLFLYRVKLFSSLENVYIEKVTDSILHALERVRHVNHSKQEQDKFFNRLYTDMYEEIYRYIRRITNDNRIMDDILQETFYEAYRKIDVLIEHENYRGWVYKTAKFKALKLINRMHSSDGKQVDLSFAQIQEAGKQDDYDCITYADYEEILTAEEYRFLMKHYVEGYTLAELADEEHISVGAGKMRLYRIIKKLRNENHKRNYF